MNPLKPELLKTILDCVRTGRELSFTYNQPKQELVVSLMEHPLYKRNVNVNMVALAFGPSELARELEHLNADLDNHITHSEKHKRH